MCMHLDNKNARPNHTHPLTSLTNLKKKSLKILLKVSCILIFITYVTSTTRAHNFVSYSSSHNYEYLLSKFLFYFHWKLVAWLISCITKAMNGKARCTQSFILSRVVWLIKVWPSFHKYSRFITNCLHYKASKSRLSNGIHIFGAAYLHIQIFLS